MIIQNAQAQPWLQTQDSPGTHDAAALNPGPTLWCLWTPAVRTSGNWDNLYVYQTSQITDQNVTLDMAVTFRTQQDLTNCNCWEIDLDKILNNQRWDGGWQARFDDGHWWLFDVQAGAWVPSGIPIRPGDFISGQPTRITCQYNLSSAGTRFISLAVQGQYNAVNITKPQKPKTASNHLNWAWQLDSRGHGAPINIALESYQVFTQ